MLPSAPAAFLARVFFAATVAAAEHEPLPSCEMGVRHIELAADSPQKVHEVCIRPELSTSLFFDSEVARVELAERQRFRVLEGNVGLALLPVGEFHDGERLPLAVYFKDSALPASATFVLVVHPSQVERQVEVSRHPRTLSSYRQGEQQARAEARQCQEDKEHLQAECYARGGLTGLVDNGLLSVKGIAAKNITDDLISRPGTLFSAYKVISYQAIGRNERGRVAVELELVNHGTTPWMPKGAALVRPKREGLRAPTVWPLEPIPPKESRRIVVEVEATESEAQGTFTLKLWGSEGGAVSFDGVTFPFIGPAPGGMRRSTAKEGSPAAHFQTPESTQ